MALFQRVYAPARVRKNTTPAVMLTNPIRMFSQALEFIVKPRPSSSAHATTVWIWKRAQTSQPSASAGANDVPKCTLVVVGASDFGVRELGSPTWPDFVRIMEKHEGVWGGCWCVAFHLTTRDLKRLATPAKAFKESLVRANRAHAALVYDGPDVVGWCQFGAPAELPGRMGRFARLAIDEPDWRLTCFFVDRDRRREGIADTALAGALTLIAAKGGGTVDGYPIATRGKPYSSSFLWSGTEPMFLAAGFSRVGALGTSKLVMRKVVDNSAARR